MSATAAVLLALAGGAAIAPPPEPAVRYAVRKGDTLIGLARRWMVNERRWPVVQRLNRVGNPYRMRIGITLQIPYDLLKVEPIGATVSAFRGDVRVGGKVPVLGAPVREGMTIATGANASVTVECTDGSRFSLPSHTVVGVARLRRILITGDLDRVFATSRGRGEWGVRPAPTPGSRFMVTTPVSVSAVRGTGFRVGYDDAAVVGVVDGIVGVSGADTALVTPIPTGMGVAVKSSGIGQPVVLLPPPDLLHPGKTQAAPELKFAVTPLPGAQSYVVEVGTDAGFVDRVQEARGVSDRVILPGLPDGSYFIRATATDGQGIDGFSRIWAFERMAFGTKPPETIGRGMRFRWTGGEGRREYRFTLFADEAATRPLIDRDGVIETMITVTDLKPGTYWWRVAATRFGDGAPVTAVGDLQSFTIAAPTRVRVQTHDG